MLKLILLLALTVNSSFAATRRMPHVYRFTDTTASSSTTTGSATFSGGLGVGKALYAGGILSSTTATDNTMIITGNPGSVTRFMHPAASGEYNFQIGRWNAASTFEITPSTLVDGSTFSSPLLKMSAVSGIVTIGASGGSAEHVINGTFAKVPTRGTATNDDAAAGFIGEYLDATTTSSAYPCATAVFCDVVSRSLTAGDWDCWASYDTYGNTVTTRHIGISSAGVSGNNFSDRADNKNHFLRSGSSADEVAVMTTPIRVKLASTTTIYVKATVSFAAGTPTLNSAYIGCRRVR